MWGDAVVSPERYAEEVLHHLRGALLSNVSRLIASGTPLAPPEELAALLAANLPSPVEELDPHYAEVGPFFGSEGALRQLGGVTKQALASRRNHETVLALPAGNAAWLYPAWQFTGKGTVHPALRPVLAALKGMERWTAAVWLVAGHPDLRGASPRAALRNGANARLVAALAAHDKRKLMT